MTPMVPRPATEEQWDRVERGRADGLRRRSGCFTNKPSSLYSVVGYLVRKACLLLCTDAP